MSQAASPFRTVLVTRPAHQAAGLTAALAARGFTAVAAPVLTLKMLDANIPKDGTDALVFTSANGVAAFAALGGRCDGPVFAVGAATATAARAAGFARVVTGADGAAALAGIIRAHLPRGASVLYPAARDTAFDLPAVLAEGGIAATKVTVYEMTPAEALPEAALAAVAAGCVAPFFSRRSLAAFPALAAGRSLARVAAVLAGFGGAPGAEVSPFAQAVSTPVRDAAGLVDFLARLETVKGDL